MNKLADFILLVTGDTICDYHILKGERMHASSKKTDTEIMDKTGGAELTFDLLFGSHEKYLENIVGELHKEKESLIEKRSKNDLGPNDIKKIEDQLKDNTKQLKQSSARLSNLTKRVKFGIRKGSIQKNLDSYIQWNLHTKKDDKDAKYWDAEYLGFGETGFGGSSQSKNSKEDFVNFNSFPFILIDDASLGFRDSVAEQDFPGKTVILKMSKPLAKGKLFKALTSPDDSENKPKDVITIVNLANLRDYDVKVSKGISWEQTALDLAFELVTNKEINPLLKSHHLIVTIGSAGALYVKNGSKPERAEFQLIFDPENMEGEWEEKSGSSIGLGAGFTAGFTREFIEGYFAFCADNENDTKEYKYFLKIDKMVRTGLNYIRTISKYGLITNKEEKEKKIIQAYPLEELSNSNTSNPSNYITTFIPSPYWNMNGKKIVDIGYLNNNRWNILEGNYFPKEYIKNSILKNTRLLSSFHGNHWKLLEEVDFPEPYYELARDVVLKGSTAIQYAPKIQFGGFTSFDRNEIESLRNIRKLMLEYQSDQMLNRPLNIAIFGQPGAGKSFAVKQIAKNVLGKDGIEFLEFNISQFIKTDGLTGVFHEIRDVALEGKLPVVFWDEFDSEELTWLKEFITPMQDGFFQEAGRSHPLGKCIFFFAGGTKPTYESFNPEFYEKEDSTEESEDVKDFRKKKGPDFLSRINGYLNVLGPNRREIYNKVSKKWEEDKNDVCFPVRRALFLRGAMRLKDGQELNMDWGLMSAFLEISKFIRGSRSFERLLHQLQLNNPSKYVRSSLPSDEVIAMNVDYDEFMKLLYKDREMEKFSESMAKNIHAAWMGFTVSDSSFFNEYSKLNYEGRKNNISAAVRMFDIINSTTKYKVVSDDTSQDASKDFQNHIKIKSTLEQLAEEEHNGWLLDRVKVGWVVHKKNDEQIERNDYFKSHNCIVTYSDLEEEQKDKDRESIQNYAKFLQDSGFLITKLST
jgi:hypothetical protein